MTAIAEKGSCSASLEPIVDPGLDIDGVTYEPTNFMMYRNT